MSNGYLVAARADLAAARELGEGFELEVLELAAAGEGAIPTLAAAANVGILLSVAGTRDGVFYALVQKLSLQLPRAQLILVDAEAQAMFGFFPQSWPSMALEEALRRAAELKRRREPAPPTPQGAPEAEERQAPPALGGDARERAIDIEAGTAAPSLPETAPDQAFAADAAEDAQTEASAAQLEDIEPPAPLIPPLNVEPPEEFPGEPPAALHEPAAPAPEAEPEAEPEPAPEPAREEAAIEPPSPSPPRVLRSGDARAAPSAARAPTAPASAPSPPPYAEQSAAGATPHRAGASLTADASAFAPKKLRRETPELVRVVMHQPHQLKDVIKAAKQIDPRTEAAPQGMRVGDIGLGQSVGVSLDVRGASCDGALQRRIWNGEPIDFSFTLEAEAGVKQAVILARVFVGDAQVGVIGFTRPISGPSKKPASGERLKLRRHKRVFLSYSSQDRETVSTIASAYEAAGVAHFWDRASLKSGEEWSPRLRKEIDRADLFHLCWSKAASKSEWVITEAEHALTRRRRSNGKNPDITVQMLDGPPWAPHPASLDSINFDDFVRAAIVGYARGDGADPA
jgi:TIR domain-containing protein